MSNNFKRNLSEFEQIDQRFATGNLTSVIQYIESLKFPLSLTESENGYVAEKPKSERTALYQNSEVFLDSGDGRVSKGLRGLELLSRLCKGVPPANLFLFNNVIYSSNPRAVKAASKEELISIIVNNLGMLTVLQNAEQVAPSEVNKFKDLCYSIGYEVKSGIFNQEKYKRRVLAQVKRLAIAAARNTNGVSV